MSCSISMAVHDTVFENIKNNYDSLYAAAGMQRLVLKICIWDRSQIIL